MIQVCHYHFAPLYTLHVDRFEKVDKKSATKKDDDHCPIDASALDSTGIATVACSYLHLHLRMRCEQNSQILLVGTASDFNLLYVHRDTSDIRFQQIPKAENTWKRYKRVLYEATKGQIKNNTQPPSKSSDPEGNIEY